MKVRNVLVLSFLILIVIGFTVAEQYRRRQQQVATEAAAARERTEWETRLNRMFDARWRDLSAEVRHVLDSLALSWLAEIPAASIIDSAPPVSEPKIEIATATAAETEAEAEAETKTAEASATGSPTAIDSLPQQVAAAYESAIAALPADLSDYEHHVAIDEVAYLIRTRFALSESALDSLLHAASQ